MIQLEKKENFAQKAALAGVVLVAKRVILQFIFTASNIFLARLLFPADFGIFAIVGSVTAFFTVFADLGLSPAIIQKRGRLEKIDVWSVLSVQLILGFLVIVVIFLTSNLIGEFYHLGAEGGVLLRVLSLVFLISPFRLIPSAILERNLNYGKLAAIEVLGLAFGSGSAVFLALAGFGVYSLVFGQIVGQMIAALLYWQVSKWPVGFGINIKNLISMSRFGLPFQTNQIFGLFYGPLILLYLGKQVGPDNLGFFQFAASVSVAPLAFSDIVSRIVFPLGARVAHNRAIFGKIVERSVMLVSATTLPMVSIFLVVAPDVIHFVYSDRWLPAIPAVYLGLLQMTVVSFTGVFSQLLLSLGRASLIRNFGLFWAILTWILAPILIGHFNFVGMSMASLLVSTSGLFLYFRIKKEVNFSFWGNFYPYFLMSAISGFGVFLVNGLLPKGIMTLAFSLLVGGFLYLGLILFFKKKLLLENFRFLLLVFKKG